MIYTLSSFCVFILLLGKGMSIWDTFVREPGKIADNSTGDDACKSYEKYLEDVQLMKNLNVRNA